MKEEEIEVALALVKPEGFNREVEADGTEVFTAEISYPIAREALLVSLEQLCDKNPADLGFHYTPYNFDSRPEVEFFERMLEELNLAPADIEDIYFTGALTSPNKTDFRIEYRDVDGHWRSYVPDFIIRKPAAGRTWGKCSLSKSRRSITASPLTRTSSATSAANQRPQKKAGKRSRSANGPASIPTG